MNSTLQYFILAGYLPLPVVPVRYLLVALCLLLYVVVLVLNWGVVLVVVVDRSLHRPMYLFLCSLMVNEAYGSSGLFPLLLLQLPRDVHLVAPSFCFLQIFCLYTYVHVEFCSLALMSYDRYLAICCPLQYAARMSLGRAAKLVLLVWIYSFLKFLVTLSLNLRLTYCGNVLQSLHCHNYLVARLACSGNRVNNIFGLFGTVVTILVPLVPILFSYVRILKICSRGTRRMRQKALTTCAPHVVSLLNFSFGCGFEIIQSRFDMTSVSTATRLVMSLYFLLIQPLLNPLLYGLQTREVRSSAHRLLCGGQSTTH